MKKYAKRPDGYQGADYEKADRKKKLKWINTLRVGDLIWTCRNRIETIASIDIEDDDMVTTDGWGCSLMHCCGPADFRTHLSMRRWVKRNPARFHKMLSGCLDENED